MPYGIIGIGHNAFADCLLYNVVLPYSVKIIESAAFYGCSDLECIFIPNSVEYIGSDAFAECDELTIYAEAPAEPAKWEYDWNPDELPVIWNHKQI